MTAAKIMDIISRLLGCDGEAADAVSAYTQVKMEDAHKLLKIPKSECPDIWIRQPRHKWPKSWSSMERCVTFETGMCVPIRLTMQFTTVSGMEKLFTEVLDFSSLRWTLLWAVLLNGNVSSLLIECWFRRPRVVSASSSFQPMSVFHEIVCVY